MSKPEARKTPGKKMMTTTYKKGGKVKKKHGWCNAHNAKWYNDARS